MKVFSVTTIAALSILLLPVLSYGQQAEAPVYKSGDWWRVKVEYELNYGSEQCTEEYSEYLVKIDQGKPNVYGISKGKEEEIDCPLLARDLLNIPNEREYLKFPLTVKSNWSSRWLSRRGTYRYPDYKVSAWEKVRTPKGKFDTFKIQQFIAGNPRATYNYSPKIKAIILFKWSSRRIERTVTLVDFNVSN